MMLNHKEVQRLANEYKKQQQEYRKRQRERKLSQDEYHDMEMWLYDPEIENAGDRV